MTTPIEQLLFENGWTRRGYCRKNLHDLTQPGSKTKKQGCRICWNEYQKDWRQALREKEKGQ